MAPPDRPLLLPRFDRTLRTAAHAEHAARGSRQSLGDPGQLEGLEGYPLPSIQPPRRKNHPLNPKPKNSKAVRTRECSEKSLEVVDSSAAWPTPLGTSPDRCDARVPPLLPGRGLHATLGSSHAGNLWSI